MPDTEPLPPEHQLILDRLDDLIRQYREMGEALQALALSAVVLLGETYSVLDVLTEGEHE